MLVPSTVDDRTELHARIARTDIERADPFRAVHLVRRQREQVRSEFVNVDGNPADCLGRVSMEKNPSLLRHAADLFDRLDRADLVIGLHDRDKNRFFRNRLAQPLEINQAIRVHRKIGHAIAMLL